MRQSIQPVRRAARFVRLGLALLVAAGLAGAGARPAHAAAPSVLAFYTTTAAAYQAWDPTTGDAPPRRSAFPAGVRQLAFFFAYRGAVGGVTRFKILIYGPRGRLVATSGVWTLRYETGTDMNLVTLPPAHGLGRYHAALIMKGQALARTTFMVGAGGARARPPAARPGLRISAFYPVSKASFDAWDGVSAIVPPPLSTYASGSTDIVFYVAYHGAVPGQTTLQIILYLLPPSSGSSSGQVNTLALRAGRWMMDFHNTSDPFPDGAYRGDLLVNGQVVASARLTVGAPAP